MKSPNRQHDLPLLYKYATAKTALAVLTSQSLRYSSPILFNDPFDVPRDFDLGFTFEELRSALVARFRDYLDGRGAPRTPRSRELLAIMQGRLKEESTTRMLQQLSVFVTVFVRQAFEKSKEEFQRAWEERIPGMRICCFSETDCSAVMWVHYGDVHRGVVLQFESSDDRDSVSLLAQPVLYQSTKPALPAVAVWAREMLGEAERDWDASLREYFFAKAREWSYEREYRVATHKGPTEEGLFSDYVFHTLDLRGIVFGSELRADEEARIREIRKERYPHVNLYRTRIDRRAMTITKDLVEAGV